MPQVDYEEQILFIEVGFDLDEDTGALVRVLVDEVQAAQGQGIHALEKIVFQILESPKNSETHVTTCMRACGHACYVANLGRLRKHIPSARNVTILQLRCNWSTSSSSAVIKY